MHLVVCKVLRKMRVDVLQGFKPLQKRVIISKQVAPPLTLGFHGRDRRGPAVTTVSICIIRRSTYRTTTPESTLSSAYLSEAIYTTEL